MSAASTRARILPLVAFVIVAGITGLTSAVIVRDDARHRRENLESDTAQAALRLEDYIRARLLAVDSVHEAWELGRLSDQETFEQRVSSVIDRFGGFQAINWIDERGVIRWVVPLQPNLRARDRSVFEHPQAAPFARRAGQTFTPQMTSPIDLFQGVRGFASYFPVIHDGVVIGYLNGVFRVNTLVEECLGRGILDQYRIRVSDGDDLVYRSPGASDEVFDPSAVSTIQLMDRTWSVHLAYRDLTHAGDHRQLTLWLLSLGLALAAGLAVFIRSTFNRQEERQRAERRRLELERQLQQSQKMEAVGRLAGGVAHDFNNLMTSVLANAEVVASSPTLNGDERTCLTEIVHAAQRSGDLCAKLLTFSRQRPTEPEPLDLQREMNQLVGMLRRLVRENIDLTLDLAGERWPVLLDPVELSQIIMNLVVNAADAMPEGGAITVSTRTETETAHGGPKDWVVLAVTDTGSGMSAEVKERALEPFFTTKPVGQGTGLGLATVFGIVAAAGGLLEIDSEPGRGSTVEIRLPRAHGTVQTTQEPARAAAHDGAADAARILLVEDDEHVRRSVERVLARAGFEVLSAHNGRHGLELFDENCNDHLSAVVCDLVMPVMGGDELARRIRRRAPDLPIILWSGHSSDAIDHDELDRLRIAFATKPIRPRDLVGMLEGMIGGRRGQGSGFRGQGSGVRA